MSLHKSFVYALQDDLSPYESTDFYKKLQDVGGDIIQVFESKAIDEKSFLKLSEAQIKALHLKKGPEMRLMRLLADMKKQVYIALP